MGAPKSRIRHKHFRLDSSKILRAQKVLRTETETETIERALDMVLSEYKKNQLVWTAQQHFLDSGIEVKDLYGQGTE